MLKSFVLDVNKENMFINVIKFYKWDGIEIKESLLKGVNHKAGLLGLENDINYMEIKKRYYNFILSLADDKNFKKFTDRLKEYIPKNRVTKKDLLIAHGLEENFNCWDDIQLFIINNVIPVIKADM